MANMSYCRFENTLSDLQDCEHAMRVDGFDDLSKSELAAAKRMVSLCKKIADNADYMEEIEAAERYQSREIRDGSEGLI